MRQNVALCCNGLNDTGIRSHQPFFRTFIHILCLIIGIFLYLEELEWNTTKPYGLNNQKLYYIPICLSWRKRQRLFFNPLPDDKILDWSKLKQFADYNFKFDENSKKFSKRVENSVGQGENARYEQFLLSHSVFKRLASQGRQKVSLCGNGLKVDEYGICSKYERSGNANVPVAILLT